jgi:hypothetical protein
MNTFYKIENESEWEVLLGQALFKTFFHTPEWEGFLEKEFSWMKFERYVWKDELLLSIARCKLFGREKVVSHPLCEYGGPLPLAEGVDYPRFERDFIREFGSKARIHFHPRVKAGSSGDLATFWIEDFSKKTPEDLWGNFRKTLKQEIKKGQGFAEIGECQNENELKQFYNLYLRTVKRHKNIPFPFSAFTFFNARAKVFLARKMGKIIGGSILLFYKPFIHYFISASDERFRDQNVGHQILWHVFQKYATGEYDYFDLGGTRKGSALEVFKRGWGGREIPIYDILTFCRMLECRNSKFGKFKFKLRNVLGLLPASVMARIAKYALWFKI